MTWRELLQADAERLAHEYLCDDPELNCDFSFKAGAQLPNERLLKLVEALELACELLRTTEDDFAFYERKEKEKRINDTLVNLRAELEKL
jgi:hypothetical protein